MRANMRTYWLSVAAMKLRQSRQESFCASKLFSMTSISAFLALEVIPEKNSVMRPSRARRSLDLALVAGVVDIPMARLESEST